MMLLLIVNAIVIILEANLIGCLVRLGGNFAEGVKFWRGLVRSLRSVIDNSDNVDVAGGFVFK